MGIYDNWTYTDLHQLNLDWILKEVKKLIVSNAELVHDMAALQKYVADYFDNLDVSAEVNAKLDEMISDGTMDQIIADVVNSLLNKEQVLPFARVMRYASPTYEYDDSDVMQRWVCQGSCYTKNNQFIFSNVNATTPGQSATFREYNYDGQLIRTFTLPTGHTNSMAYDAVNERLAINKTIIDPNDGTETYALEIDIYDYNTLTLLSTIPTGVYPNQLAFDDNGSLFFVNKPGTVLNVYNEFNELIAGNILLPVPSYTLAGFRIYNNNFWFLSHAPNAIYVYNGTDIEHIYNLGEMNDQGFVYGEPEAFDLAPTGDLLLFTSVMQDRSAYCYSQIFRSNVKYGAVSTRSKNVRNILTMCYATSGNPNTNGSMNPDGTAAKPFPTLDEACLMVNNLNTERLILSGTFEHQILQIEKPCVVYATSGTPVCAGFYFRYVTGVMVYGINFTTDYTVASGTINTVSYSDVMLNQCIINTGNAGNTSGHNSIYRSRLFMRGNANTITANTSFAFANSVYLCNQPLTAVSSSNTVQIDTV